MTIRVAFHQAAALRPTTGVGRYTAELLSALRNLGPDLAVSGLPSGLMAGVYRWTHGLLAAKKSAGTGLAETAPPDSGQPRSSRLKSLVRGGYQSAKDVLNWNVQRQLTSRRFDLYHEPNFLVLPTELPTVLTIHDLSMTLMPEFHPRERVAAFEKQLPHALKQASHIITVSEFIREEIIRVLSWPADRVTCTYEGANPSLKPIPAERTRSTLHALGLPASYLLFVGTLEPRKNLLRLMQSYCRLPAELRERCPLLLVGSWGWKIREAADYFESHARHHGVIQLGHLPDEHLCAVYNGARALVYPSLYEGFGLPPLEMMACGGPVLASTAGSLKELFAGPAHLIDAFDDAGWTDAMARVIRDDDWRALLRKDVLSHAAQFSWQRCAEATRDVYHRVLGQQHRRAA